MLKPPQKFLEACTTLGFDLPESIVEPLSRYLHLLLETNRKFNLTSVRDPDEAWMRHILDSLSVLPFIGESRSIIDVGSGGGLPGIPLAINLPEARVTLMEVTGKKADFLRQAIDHLGLTNVTVVQERAETAGQNPAYRHRYEIAVARAIGPLRVMLECTLPLVSVGGRVLAMKGRKAEEELREAGDAIMLLGGGEVNVYEAMPEIETEAVIVEIAKDHNTHSKYPRGPGIPKQNPL